MIKKLGALFSLFLLVLAASAASAATTTTKDENDLLIRQAWRAGQQMIESGLYRKGVGYLEAYVKNRPGSADGWYWLGKGYQGMGMLKKAQSAFTQALEVDPEYPPLSRVFQNRETGEAIPLMDPSGSDYKQGLPIVDPGKDIFEDRIIGRPAPMKMTLQSGPSTPTGAGVVPQVPAIPESKPVQANPKFSPMGARKTVITPPAQVTGFNPVVPIPPVKNLTGEPEGPGIPMIEIPDEVSLTAVPASGDKTARRPEYMPPDPHSENPVYMPPSPEKK